MKKDRKVTTPLIAAHSANKNNRKPVSSDKKATARASNIPKSVKAKTKSLTLDRITEGILALDEDMKYTYVNGRAGELLGCKPKDLIGSKLTIHKTDKPPFVDACKHAFKTQTVVPFHGYWASRRIWLDGCVYPSEDGVSVLFSDDKIPADTTENKQAEESLRPLIDQTTAGILRVNMDAILTFVNQTVCEMLGYSEAELLGKTIWEITHSDDVARCERLFEQLRAEGKPYQLEKRLVRKNGSIVWVNVGTSLLRDASGKAYSAVSMLADITRRKRAEESLLETARRSLYLSSLSDTIRHISRPFQIEIEAVHALGVHLKASRVAYAEIARLDSLLIRHDYVNGVKNSIGEFQLSNFVPAELLAKFRSGRPVMITDVRNDLRFSETQRLAHETAAVHSQLVVPLVKDDQLIAALIVQQSEPRTWSNEEINLVEETADRMQNAMERAFTESKLHESEKRFRILSNTVPSMVWSTAADGTVLYLNEHWHQYTGLTTEQTISSWAELSVHPDDKESYLASWKEALATVPDEYLREVRYRRYDGEYRWFQSRAIPVRDENGQVNAWYGVSTDVHDRVEKQEELQQIINQTPFMLVRCSRDMRYRFVSRAYAEMIGLTPEDVAGRPIVEIMGEEGLRTITPYVERVLLGQRVEYEMPVPFEGIGTPWLHVVYTPDRDTQGNIIGWFASIVDVTARKEVEQKLRARAEEIEAVLDVSPVGIFVSYDPECARITANPTGYELLQMRDQPGANISKSALPPDQPSYRVFRDGVELAAEQMPMQMAARLGMDVEAQVIELHFEDGSRKFLYAYARPLFDEQGRTRGAVAAMLDLSERKQMEEQLTQSNHRLAEILSSIQDEFYVLDRDWKFVYASKLFTSKVGKEPKDFIGNNIWTMFPKHLDTDLEENFRAAMEQREVRRFQISGKYTNAWYQMTAFPSAEGITVLGTDITERKRAEQSLIEYARRQTALYTLTDQLHRANTMQDVYNSSLNAILDSLQCDRASILLFDETRVMYFVAWRGLSDEYRRATDGHSPWKYGEENAMPIAYNDITTADLSESLKAVITQEGIRSLIFIPLVFRGNLIGKFMVYFNEPHEFSESELDLSHTIARQLASGIQRKRNETELRQSEERFSRFMQYLPGLAWIKDREGRYVYANAAAEKVFKKPRAELYGKRDDEVFPPEIASQFKRNDEQALVEGRGIQVVETLPQEDGLVHHSLVTKFPILGPDGEAALIGGTAFDITERQQMEAELLASRQRLAATYELSPIGLVEYSPEGRFIKVNEEICRILGYERDELLNLTMQDVTHKDDYPAEEIQYRQLIRGEISSYKIEKRFIRKDGSLVWAQKTRSAVRDAQGKVLYTIGAIIDISERKRADGRLALLAEVSELIRNIEEPDQLMSAVAYAIGAHLLVKRCLFNEIDLENDIEVVYRDYHDATESVEGFHKISEYSSITTAEMIDGHTVVNRDSKLDPRTAQDYERSYATSGERAYVAVPLMRDDRWVASLWVSTDTPRDWSKNDISLLETIAERTWTATEKLRIHAELRESEERLRVTFNTTAVGFATLDLDTRFVQVNDAFCHIVGYSREELFAMTCYSLTHPDFIKSTQEHVRQLVAGEIPSFVLEKLYIRGDGRQIWVQNSVSLLRDADGNPSNLITICQDVTERRNTEDQLHKLNLELDERVQRRTAELQAANEFLRESEATSRLILESVPDAIVIANAEGQIVHCNTQVEGLFGFSPNELLGQPVETLLPKRYREQYLIDRASIRALTYRRILGRQLFGLRRNGEEFPAEVALAPISNSTTWDVIVTIRDNTEQRQAQEALRISEEKLRTLFEILPVGISFLDQNAQIIEMNNALAQILGLSKQELLQGSFLSRKYIRSDGSTMPRSEFASIRALTEQKTVYNVETGVIKESGETIWTSINAAPVKVADVEAVVVTVDITERKNAADALHKSRERLRALSRRLVEVQEEERRAIARELHDRVGQNLAALNLNLNILRSQLSEDALAKVGARLTDSVQLVNDILTITRSVMADLRSNVLDDYGLESALREYADQFTQRFGIRIVTDKPVDPIPRFDPSIEMTLLRITQEALTNVARHSQASQATIRVRIEENTIHMAIQDNGIGILSWQKANQQGSHGLRIIRERAEAFGGSMQIQSAYKKGTTIEVSIPIEVGVQPRLQREKRS